MKPEQLLCPKPEGLYCAPGDFYIDPVKPVARAVITHGHSDHARGGHGAVLATPETLDIMRERYGAEHAQAQQAAAYGEVVNRDGVEIWFAPAGHVLGSAQAVVQYDGVRIVVSGDYKRTPDPTCPAFEPVPCDVFVTEATFGLPVFTWDDPDAAIARLLESVRQFPERSHLIGAYALGKAQRLIRMLRLAGWERPIYVHGALEKLNALYERHGIDLGPLSPATTTRKSGGLAGEIVVGPPSAVQDRWGRRFADPVTCFASGWMRVKSRARLRGVELPLVLSDHCDWPELTRTIAEVSPGEVWVTHGREEGLLRWCELNGYAARALALVGYEDDDFE